MELFDAVEEARYLALGINRYAGAADNIDARLRDDCVRAALDAAQTRSARGFQKVAVSLAVSPR